MAGFKETQRRGAHGRWAGSTLRKIGQKIQAQKAGARKSVKISILDAANLHQYTKDSYRINHGLWKKATPDIHDFEAKLNQTLSKFPAHKGTAFCEVDLSNSAIARYKVGATVTEKGFVSTSAKRDPGFAGNVKFVIHSKTGRQIWDHSNHPKEKEILFHSKTKFKVLAKKYNPKLDQHIIYLSEVGRAKN